MEFPFGHHHHHHHRRDDDEQEYQPPAPPPFEPSRPPPPAYDKMEEPPFTHVHHTSHVGGEPYPPPHRRFPDDDAPPPPIPLQSFYFSDSPNYPPPAPGDYSSSVVHVSHESGSDHHHHNPHMPSFVHHHSHHRPGNDLADRPSFRVFCKAGTNYSLSIRDEQVILAQSNPSDPYQHWIKDEKYSTKVKDAEGLPAFALVNKATGQAMKHSIGATHPVQLIPYNPDVLDESILWTLSKDTGDDYRAIRMVNNISLNVDAFHGDKDHGGVLDGTTIVLWEWAKGENQRWKVVRY